MVRKSTLWTEARVDELKREIKNYNRRVKTAAKKYPKNILPPTYKFIELKEAITTGREFRTVVNSLKRATSKTLKPDKTGTTTIYNAGEQKRYEASIRRNVSTTINQQDDERRKKLEDADLSQRLGRLYDSRDFLIRDIGRTQGVDALDKLSNWLVGNNRVSSERWRSNYLQTINENIGFATIAGLDDDVKTLQELYNKIQTMDLLDFLIGMIAEGNELNIGFLLDSFKRGRGGASANQVANHERLLDLWTKYG